YDKGPFTPSGLSVTMRGRVQDTHRTRWRYGDPVQDPSGRLSNLGGTARTLDDVDGPIELEPGLLSYTGYAVVDDSASLLMTQDGWVRPRPGGGEDLYFFGHGRDYAAVLREFFRLTGPSPLLPRWALGNWWSRYHPYSDQEYLDLMDRFSRAGIPFSVAVLDMDWHLVDIDPRLGTGWTGYTWNRELFPDPAAFLDALHDRHLRVTLNVHPGDGVRAHEEAYAAVAEDLGLDPSTGHEISFDITSRAFVQSYLRRLHHPHEEIGVDFWWLDWQSGTASRIPGLDPLWLLNHVHYHDSGRDGGRPLTFSRYAGLGSHRYPVGFSGDTVVSWESLRFQPTFTATAANVGYFWWSHDVGGHLGGAKDDELATRWFQLGTFSPVNRLHSTHHPFNSKEPWRFGPQAEQVMTRFLRLRHHLVPYLYSAMWASHTEGTAPIRPMYHDHPQAPDAYTVPRQLAFGPDLLVAPVTWPSEPRTHLARVDVWLPPGRWYDLLTGRRYTGDRTLALHRPLADLPVLARAGTVLPLAGDPMADPGLPPDHLVLVVVPGADGGCTILEDDGTARPAERHETRVEAAWQDGSRLLLTVRPPTGAGVRTRREITVRVVEVVDASAVHAHAGGRPVDVRVRSGATPAGEGPEPTEQLVGGPRSLTVDVGEVDLSEGLEVRLDGVRAAEPDVSGDVFALLDQAEVAYDLKARVQELVDRTEGRALLGALHAMDLPGHLYGALVEIVAADG
ncbi:glycoside hydrolase family 31 protein, partial [Georgenia sp. 10Sc9-8]|nr:glycoside hydrolase family 31 protein [Georgenia halotolerans]